MTAREKVADVDRQIRSLLADAAATGAAGGSLHCPFCDETFLISQWDHKYCCFKFGEIAKALLKLMDVQENIERIDRIMNQLAHLESRQVVLR